MTTTREKIIELREKYPDISQAEMARQIGVTRERIRQLLNILELPLVPIPEGRITIRECANCNISFEHFNIKINQPKKKVFCNIDCEIKYRWVDLTCCQCQGTYYIKRARYNARKRRGYNLNFCNKSCQGRYLGKNFGAKSRLKN